MTDERSQQRAALRAQAARVPPEQQAKARGACRPQRRASALTSGKRGTPPCAEPRRPTIASGRRCRLRLCCRASDRSCWRPKHKGAGPTGPGPCKASWRSARIGRSRYAGSRSSVGIALERIGGAALSRRLRCFPIAENLRRLRAAAVRHLCDYSLPEHQVPEELLLGTP